ncbi:cro/C1 family transcription regulator [Natrialba magadii ATCC 43099]|uniref:Cro/C1 family transcription regulator n=1 Tax=Natrialba magadii (strain ATCC 43099 / DSM 3394 / CCM 3739 / CIP 104546 / IAM 13178 / JCM 8861 / NBRC 102185 / NCIMB 2190 / MS3) TaxID=547559 RepID=D3T0I7_NATMM|nr:helix-turn-helix transcriptional regulator [Natrialba magadii]ADD06466.1 cro/C1 family transcription regulator [Natrialba magadii ATCC 43099]ELY31646.1 XRE family transcriptional regulator [Natrialba magadii ATCC 43099]
MENQLTERREEAGLSQGDLAEAVDVTRQTINAIERERYDPSLELAFKLAAFFECHIEELFEPDFELDLTPVSELESNSG